MGHGCCTALAVIGGRYVSTKISVKHGTDLLSCPAFDGPGLTLFFSPVTLAGSILFILFGFIYLYEAFHPIDIDVSDITYHS